jgi:hypothetical protein
MKLQKKFRLQLVLSFFLIIAIALRVWNLETTSRFLWDESSDLLRMQEIWESKKITLIGPISEDGNKVFSSLTYYMLLPAAIAGGFGLLSPVYASVFWGLLTIILFVVLLRTKKLDSVKFLGGAFLLVIWLPLIQVSRWAWNPNLIPFWVVLSLLCVSRKKLGWKLLAGLSMGMTIHHHYLSAFMIMIYILSWGFYEYKNKIQNILVFSLGVFLAITPFIVFDLMHPPGLFLSRILYFNYLGLEGSIPFWLKIRNIYIDFFKYVSGGEIMAIIVFIIASALVFIDLKTKNHKSIRTGIIWIIYLLALSMVGVVYTHYFLPVIVFFLLWVIEKRSKKFDWLSKLLLLFIIISSLIALPRILTEGNWESNIKNTKKITSIIENEITEQALVNANIVVLASEDPNIYGRKFRDIIQLHKKVNLKSKDEYYISDNLFVVTTADEERVRNDPAVEMDGFRRGILKTAWIVDGSDWKVYRFDRY